MAIRWSKKGKRFYDDASGHPVSRTSGFRSSIGRDTYSQAHRRRQKKHKPARRQSTRPAIRKRYEVRGYEVRGPEIGPGYKVRPLEEEFREELAQFDGTLKEGLSFYDYMEFLNEEQDEALESDDQYSED
jgi:hypothetical protein